MSRIGWMSCFTGVIVSIFSACGKKPEVCDPDALLDKPQVCPDRASLGFAQEFNSGTFIGQKPQETLTIRNGGLADLEVTKVTFSGDSAFAMKVEPPVPASVVGNKYLFINVIFAPTQAKAYSGTITVESNAENNPTQTFAVSGCGVPADGGTSPCYRDGGTATP